MPPDVPPTAPAPPAAPPGWRILPAFDLLLLALLVLATRLATLLHEALGHALPAALLGADVTGMRISLFGGGWTGYAFAGEAPPAAARCVVALGGIAVNLLTGAAALALAPRLARRPVLAFFAALFGAVSLLGGVAYAALGFYYGVGDPAACHAATDGCGPWIPWLLASPVAAALALWRYGTLQERLRPASTPARRIGTTLVTLGVAAAAYAGLYALEGAPFMAADAATVAQRQAEREVMRKRFEEALARARADHPGMTEEDLRRLVEASLPPLRPGEVPAKLPLVPVLATLFAAGGAAGLWKVKPATGDPIPPPSPRVVALTAGLAALLLALLATLARGAIP